MKFDLSQYETVKQRKDRLRQDNNNPVIIPLPRDISGDSAYFTVAVWRDRAQMVEGAARLLDAMRGGANPSLDVALLLMAPDSTGTAFEAKWMGQASATSWTENAEESAIGRALDNLGYHGGGRCSREEILKAKEAEEALKALESSPDKAKEDPFSDDDMDISAMPDFVKKINAMSGKRGVREIRSLTMFAVMEHWTQEKLVAFGKALGVDLLGEAKAADYTKVLEQIKKVRKGVKTENEQIGNS